MGNWGKNVELWSKKEEGKIVVKNENRNSEINIEVFKKYV